jgi:hypothetical protein
MSRSCYSDDYGGDFPGQMELYRANVERSMRGKVGQARLRELRDALLALPVKELQAETFAGGTREAPQVCALGAWALAKCNGDPDEAARMVPGDADDRETYRCLRAHDWPKLVVLDAVFVNDDTHYRYDSVEGPAQSPYAYYGNGTPVRYRRDETPAERYQRVLAWVEKQLTPPEVPSHG